jgi:hypothetical protein
VRELFLRAVPFWELIAEIAAGMSAGMSQAFDLNPQPSRKRRLRLRFKLCAPFPQSVQDKSARLAIDFADARAYLKRRGGVSSSYMPLSTFN